MLSSESAVPVLSTGRAEEKTRKEIYVAGSDNGDEVSRDKNGVVSKTWLPIYDKKLSKT